MLKLIKSNLLFFIPYTLFLLLGLYFLIQIPKSDIMIWINHHTYPPIDLFFIIMTDIGDGIAYSLLALVLLWFNFRKSIQAWLIFGLSSFSAQFLKRVIFPNTLRPYSYFQAHRISLNGLRMVPGIQILMQNSFPSGHSITGFSLALLICFWIKNKAFALPCFFLGLSIAYSRMYLFEHFLWDCYTGSIIGVLLTLSAFYFLDKSQWPKSSWADRGIKDYLGKREKSKGSLVR